MTWGMPEAWASKCRTVAPSSSTGWSRSTWPASEAASAAMVVSSLVTEAIAQVVSGPVPGTQSCWRSSRVTAILIGHHPAAGREQALAGLKLRLVGLELVGGRGLAAGRQVGALMDQHGRDPLRGALREGAGHQHRRRRGPQPGGRLHGRDLELGEGHLHPRPVERSPGALDARG